MLLDSLRLSTSIGNTFIPAGVRLQILLTENIIQRDCLSILLVIDDKVALFAKV